MMVWEIFPLLLGANIVFMFMLGRALIWNKGKNKSMEAIVTLHLKRISELSQEVQNLQTQYGSLEHRITTLEAEVGKWKSLFEKAIDHIRKLNIWRDKGSSKSVPEPHKDIQEYL